MKSKKIIFHSTNINRISSNIIFPGKFTSFYFSFFFLLRFFFFFRLKNILEVLFNTFWGLSSHSSCFDNLLRNRILDFCSLAWCNPHVLRRNNTEEMSIWTCRRSNYDSGAISGYFGYSEKIYKLLTIDYSCYNFMSLIGQLNCSSAMLFACDNSKCFDIERIAFSSDRPFLLLFIEGCKSPVLQFLRWKSWTGFLEIDLNRIFQLKRRPGTREECLSSSRFECEIS